jgi:hypothetical protein
MARIPDTWTSACVRIAVVALALLAVGGARASANVYTVRACDAADGVNHSWATIPSTSRGVTAYSACPSGGNQRRGLIAHNVIARRGTPSGVSRGTLAGLAFVAPPGTVIVGIRAGYHFYRATHVWRVGLWNGRKLIKGCGRGSAPCERSATDEYLPTPRSALLYVAVTCAAASCPNTRTGDKARGSLQAAASLYSATVWLEDDSPPTIDGVGGSLWSDGWHSGTQVVNFGASDDSGISETHVTADGNRLVKNVKQCDYTEPSPCPQGGDQLSVDTTTIRPDGPHAIGVEAVDAAGNVTTTTKRVMIDNAPPAPPVALSLDGGYGWRRANSFSVGWQGPPDDGGAPVAGAVYEICPAAGGACVGGERDAAGITALEGLSVPGPGDWLLRVWLRDAAGNADRRTAADPIDLRFDNEAPQAAFLPQDPNDPTRVAVQATDGVSGVASGVIEMKRSDASDWHPVETTLSGSELVAMIDDTHLRDGVYQLRARALDQAGNETSTNTRADGSAAVVTLPLRLETRMRAGVVQVRHGRHRKRVQVLSPVARVPFGKRAQLAGKLTSGDGTPLTDAQVLVQQRSDGPAGGWTPLASLKTSPKGLFTYVAPPGVSRALQFSYAGTPTIRAADREVIIGVVATTSFHVNRHKLRNGQAVVFSGRLLGGGVPPGGKLLELQVLLRGSWRTFTTLHSDDRGGWRYVYRFASTSGKVVYQFRAQIPREATYPYAMGSSRRARVTVRG